MSCGFKNADKTLKPCDRVTVDVQFSNNSFPKGINKVRDHHLTAGVNLLFRVFPKQWPNDWTFPAGCSSVKTSNSVQTHGFTSPAMLLLQQNVKDGPTSIHYISSKMLFLSWSSRFKGFQKLWFVDDWSANWSMVVSKPVQRNHDRATELELRHHHWLKIKLWSNLN